MTVRDPADRSPDVTDSVMRRLGYRRPSSAAERRSLRTRRVAIGAAQAAVVLAAVALGVAWWGGRSVERTQPAVGDALRGSVAQGAGRLDAILLGMPRVPSTSAVQSADAERASAAAPAAEPAVQVRTY
jgi:hypothetical protein